MNDIHVFMDSCKPAIMDIHHGAGLNNLVLITACLQFYLAWAASLCVLHDGKKHLCKKDYARDEPDDLNVQYDGTDANTVYSDGLTEQIKPRSGCHHLFLKQVNVFPWSAFRMLIADISVGRDVAMFNASSLLFMG